MNPPRTRDHVHRRVLDREAASDGGKPKPLPDQVTMGLLQYLTENALDEDYARVAGQRSGGSDGFSDGAGRAIGFRAAVAIAVFALLVVIAAAQTSHNNVSQEHERRALIAQVKARRAELQEARRSVANLQSANSRLKSALLRNRTAADRELSELNQLAARSGAAPVHGPGVELIVDNAKNVESSRDMVLDSDLQKIVNGLWRAGAEAISINGERLTSLSAIRGVGEAIGVNFRKLAPPYRIRSIGDPKTLPSMFAHTSSGRDWLELQRKIGLRFTMTTRDSLYLPAAAVRALRFAETGPRARTTPLR